MTTTRQASPRRALQPAVCVAGVLGIDGAEGTVSAATRAGSRARATQLPANGVKAW